jgi:AcrR family transcriptional regulator
MGASLDLLTYESVNNSFGIVSSDRATVSNVIPHPSPRRRRKEQRPGEIIEAALQEFALRGFAATRLEDVAERVGVTKGTIYVYFKDKEELFKAAARSSIEPALNEIESLAADFDGSAEELLRAHVMAAYPKMVTSPRAGQILRLLLAEGAQFPELVEFYYREIISRGLSMLKGVIDRGVARGEFRRTRATDFPQVVFGPVIAAVIWNLMLARHHSIDFEAYARTHVDLILNGLKAPRDK